MSFTGVYEQDGYILGGERLVEVEPSKDAECGARRGAEDQRHLVVSTVGGRGQRPNLSQECGFPIFRDEVHYRSIRGGHARLRCPRDVTL
eukprot:1191059-Prorocentrum_minimum.AAC.1